DQITIAHFQKNPSNGSFPFALDSLGSFSDVSLTNPEPLLYGMTGIYESFNKGTTIVDVSPTNASGNPEMNGSVTSIAYGTQNNASAACFTTGGGQIWMRNDSGKNFASVTTPSWGAAYALKIVMDPLDYHTVYVLDNQNNVWQGQITDNGQPTT